MYFQAVRNVFILRDYIKRHITIKYHKMANFNVNTVAVVRYKSWSHISAFLFVYISNYSSRVWLTYSHIYNVALRALNSQQSPAAPECR